MCLLQVYGWGRGEHGRLGFGDNDKSSKMVPQRVNLLAGEDIVQVLSTLCHMLRVLLEVLNFILYILQIIWFCQPNLAIPFVCLGVLEECEIPCSAG